MIGLRHRSLQIIIHGFAFMKFAKPVHEHNLQVLHSLANLLLYPLSGLKMLRHITACEFFSPGLIVCK
jgi:hypothetical protein